MPNYSIIVNLKAGSGAAAKAWPLLKTELKHQRINYTTHFTQYSGHAIELAKKIGDEADDDFIVVIVVGGDGTVNQTLNGLEQSAHPETPIAYFPAGSGNDFARSLHLTKRASTFVENLKSIHCSTNLNIFDIDLTDSADKTYHQHKYLINNFGTGFDAHVVHLTEHSRLKAKLNRVHLGKFAYVINLISVFRTQQTFNLKVHGAITEEFKQAYLVTLTNIPYFGGGVNIMPTADPHIHDLNLVVIEKPNLPRLLQLFVKILTTGSHLKDPAVHVFKGDTLNYKIQPKQFGQMDGEDMGAHQFSIAAKNANHPFWI
ncbi:diacylglycerol/lipid kinase family protein [Lapidilactobacillus bayanensis]|uniref:diacylglycerol/lipid kinase family protein n=1 Tax=Lapidilactobacillus bayanensis TaxID=2485998 RepID=UPI0013DDECDD|nr:YegS/Rv2252/BmrU family lipid kinase [Lapidilactobacillus bayanensis]